MWEAGRNWLRQFLIEVPHPAIFIPLLVPLASGMGVYPENSVPVNQYATPGGQVPERRICSLSSKSGAGRGNSAATSFSARGSSLAAPEACEARSLYKGGKWRPEGTCFTPGTVTQAERYFQGGVAWRSLMAPPGKHPIQPPSGTGPAHSPPAGRRQGYSRR